MASYMLRPDPRISIFFFVSLKRKEFGIERVWKDVSESSLAGQRAVA